MKTTFCQILRRSLCCLAAAILPATAVAEDARPVLLSSLYPLELIARDIAGDAVIHQQLLPPGQDPHHVSLSFSQRRALADAQLLLWVGPVLESYLAKVVSTRTPDSVMALQDLADPAETDPHVWLAPDTVQAFAAALSHRLAADNPDQAAAIRQRQQHFERSLAAQVAALRARLAPYQNRRFLSEHDAYSHFTRAMGLHSAGSLSDSSDVAVGARSLAALSASEGVACVIVEQAPGGKRARQMAQRLNVPVVAIDPLGTSVMPEAGYAGLMASVADGFERCFSTAP